MPETQINADIVKKILNEMLSGSFRMTFKLNPEVPEMIEAMAPQGVSQKEALARIALLFDVSTFAVGNLGNTLQDTKSHLFDFADFKSLESYLTDKGASAESARKYSDYFEGSYGSIKNMISNLKKAAETGRGKISKTYVVSSGMRRFLEKHSKLYGLNKSSMFEFLVRTGYEQDRRERLEEANRYYAMCKEAQEKISSWSKELNTMLKKVKKSIESDINYPLADNRPIYVLFNQLDTVSTIMDCELLPSADEAKKTYENILENINPYPDLMEKGDKQ